MSNPSSKGLYLLFVGVDISAQTASVAVCGTDGLPQPAFTVQQTPTGLAELHERLLAAAPSPAQVRVVMEVTGAYWMRLAHYLYEQGYAVSAINPTQGHHFAQALLKRAKTDALDAATFAQLALKLEPRLWSPPSRVHEELYQRLLQREGLMQMRKRCTNRMHALKHRPLAVEAVHSRLEALTKLIKQQIAAIDAELLPVIRQDERWLATAERLLSIPSIGIISASWLMVTTHNFTLCDTPEQLASFAGLVPYALQSGSSLHSHRHVGHHGSDRLRRSMYMATMSAIRFNPPVKAFYERLVARGKNGKVAVVAAAHKLLRIAWAVAVKEQMFDPSHQRTPQLGKYSTNLSKYPPVELES